MTGVILVVIGLVWTGQGAGLIAGSFMTGQTMWLVIGILALLLGLASIWWSRWGRHRR